MWIEFYKRNPWGETRADLRAGLSTATVLNAQTKGRKLKPADFVMEFKQKPQTPEEMLANARAALGVKR